MTTSLEPSLMLATADVELMASEWPPTNSVAGYTRRNQAGAAFW
ncbi:MAG: hypothetical protein ACKON9_10660 [Planctomycetaceae bacterium]